MKVLLVDVNYGISSTGKIVQSLHRYLSENGNSVLSVFGRGIKPSDTDVHKISSKLEVYIDAFLTRLTGFAGYFSPFSTRRLIRLVDRFKPDVIHLHDLHSYFLNVTAFMRYLARTEIRVVWTFHCEYMYTGKCGHAKDCTNFMTFCRHCPHLHDYPKSWLFDQTKFMFDDKQNAFNKLPNLTIVTPSMWLAKRVKKSFLKNRDIRVINNGVNTSVFHSYQTDTLREKIGAKGKHVVLSAAPDVMSSEKGGNTVLEIAKRLEHLNIMFLVVGVDDKKLILDNDRPNVLMMPRIVDQIELAKLYSLASLFLLCSKLETYSMTTVESLCCGTPVVGFCAGAPETIAIPEFSRFVPYGDIDSLAKAVESNVFLKSEQQSIIESQAHKLYDQTLMSQEYLDVYHDRGNSYENT